MVSENIKITPYTHEDYSQLNEGTSYFVGSLSNVRFDEIVFSFGPPNGVHNSIKTTTCWVFCINGFPTKIYDYNNKNKNIILVDKWNVRSITCEVFELVLKELKNHCEEFEFRRLGDKTIKWIKQK